MNILLKKNNQDLLHEIKILKKVVNDSDIPSILDALRKWLNVQLDYCEKIISNNFYYLSIIDSNLNDKLLNQKLSEEVLKQTQSITRIIRLQISKYISSIYRFQRNDNLCLKVLDWLHNEHSQTKMFPFGISDGSFSIYPSPELPILYFLPSSSQFSLLHLPLFFHEFGHFLYAYHENEMNEIVISMQKELEEFLTASFQQNDGKYAKEKNDANSIVSTWYVWLQEIFCDAVGLTIGGSAYLYSFSHYLRMTGKMAFYRPVKNLINSSHPVSWPRVKLLIDRAYNLGLTKDANQIKDEWEKLAEIMNENGNFHAYYLDSYKPIINKAIDDMLIEAEPIKFTDYLKQTEFFSIEKNNYIEILNIAWTKFNENSETYYIWEESIFDKIVM